MQREVRHQAVLDAVQRATDYAVALGLASVDVVALADVGMLGGDGRSAQMAEMQMQGAATAFRASGAPFAVNPQDVAVSAAVDARFTAS